MKINELEINEDLASFKRGFKSGYSGHYIPDPKDNKLGKSSSGSSSNGGAPQQNNPNELVWIKENRGWVCNQIPGQVLPLNSKFAALLTNNNPHQIKTALVREYNGWISPAAPNEPIPFNSKFGQFLDKRSRVIESQLNEGPWGAAAGAGLGALAGSALGPAGTAIGGAAGSYVGDKVGNGVANVGKRLKGAWNGFNNSGETPQEQPAATVNAVPQPQAAPAGGFASGFASGAGTGSSTSGNVVLDQIKQSIKAAIDGSQLTKDDITDLTTFINDSSAAIPDNTAQTIAQTRKNKQAKAAAAANAPATPAPPPAPISAAIPAALDPAVASDISAALKQLGHTPAEIQTLVASIPPGSSVEDGLRLALGAKAAPAPAAPATTTPPAPAPAAPSAPAAPRRLNKKTIAAKQKTNSSVERLLFGDEQLNEDDVAKTIMQVNQAALQESKQVVKQIATAKLKRDQSK